MFQLHFIIFHCLYRLRDNHWQQQSGLLEISPLKICLRPYLSAKSAIAEPDPLRAYYLDLQNLSATNEDDVIALLSQFWMRMNGDDERQAALKTLGLDMTASAEEIKNRYRKLVMQHHPDRGGDKANLQALNEAMAWLEKYHQHDR